MQVRALFLSKNVIFERCNLQMWKNSTVAQIRTATQRISLPVRSNRRSIVFKVCYVKNLNNGILAAPIAHYSIIPMVTQAVLSLRLRWHRLT